MSQPRTDREPELQPDRTRLSALRVAAPLLSLFVLGVLVGRASDCAPPAELVSEGEVSQSLLVEQAAPRFDLREPERATVSAPEPEPAPEPVQGVGADLRTLGGSKAGFGGLGLERHGKQVQPPAGNAR